MPDDRIRIARGVDRATWDRLVESSPESTPFARSSYLEACGRRWEAAIAMKGDSPRAGILLLPSDDGLDLELDDLVVYGGVLHSSEIHALPAASGILERFRATEAIATWLADNFRNVSIACSPRLDDLRPFLWHDYHGGPQARRYAPDLRYTQFLELPPADQPEEETHLWKGMDGLRRRNVREGRAAGATVSVEAVPSDFARLYRELMASQGCEPPPEKLSRMERLVAGLTESGLAVQTTCRSATGGLLYTCVFLLDRGKAIYLFGAGPVDSKERYQGTLCFWESFRILARDHGVVEIDMEGINSPRRGAFKTSFGGRIAPYFELHRTTEGDRWK
ncbi:MAG TPA: GNAT family N-acetyltransferase [Fibrobacteria bacterium]|nr:GNAT family N-acetyltransferase [Fibrobacteria bacterium]